MRDRSCDVIKRRISLVLKASAKPSGHISLGLKAVGKTDGRFSLVLRRGLPGKHGKRNVCVLHFASG